MSGAGVRASGLTQVQKSLRKAGDELGDFRSTNDEAADYIAARARPAVPRRSGALAASIRPGATNAAATVSAGSASVPYAGPILWGWRARGIRPAAATPYSVALDTFDAWIELYYDEVEHKLDQIRGA